MGKKNMLDINEFEIEFESKENKEVLKENKIQEKGAEEKKKVGRPKIKEEETKTVNIAVPVSVLEKIETAKVCYKNNMTLYINTLISKDLEENYTRYKQVIEELKQLNII